MTKEAYSWIAKLSNIGTHLFTLFSGDYAGKDKYGNRYYRERGIKKPNKAKRWVVYDGRPEASYVPPEWHGWLHYTFDEPLPEESEFHRPWIKAHQPNLTFSNERYEPPALKKGKRDHATGDYQAWVPDTASQRK